ncbi:MAG: hypothetical protein M0R69_04850 [Candidatus Cloacimonetes bacterium]|jgi:F0F1-type ATP synthase membrane subunit b/b'|nr:hypothetical protein [Candidatus Cloacimonadota bacterium]
MDNYDHIAQDLKLTIDEYKHNLESLKDRFADIGNIINQLDQLKLQAQHSGSKGDEFFVKVANLELKHAELSDKLSVLSEDYENALTNLKTQLSEWNKSIEVIVQDASSSITDLRSDYHDKLNKAVANIAQQAKQDASSLDQYLQQFSRTLLTEIEKVRQDLSSSITLSVSENSNHLTKLINGLDNSTENNLEKVKTSIVEQIEVLARLLEKKIESAEILSVQKINDLRNAVMLDLRHTRKINIAGFIVVLAFIIGLILYLVLAL